MTFKVKIEPSDPTLLQEQVAADIRRAIGDPGEKLPSAHDLGAVLGANADTVPRSLRILRDERILEFQRGRGIMVAGGAQRKSIVRAKAQEPVRVAWHNGYRRDELIRLIESLP